MTERCGVSPPLVLGSASPRRAALLRQLGIEFTVQASDIPEEPVAGEGAGAFARRAACEKGAAVARERDHDWVLSADTIVVVDGIILGKPRDAAEAERMLAQLAGRAHEVLTAVALFAPGAALVESFVVATAVEFRPLDAAEIAAYVATGEPLDKAGAYALQGGAAGFVRAVRGSSSSVIGLPLDEVRTLLARHGLLDGR